MINPNRTKNHKKSCWNLHQVLLDERAGHSMQRLNDLNVLITPFKLYCIFAVIKLELSLYKQFIMIFRGFNRKKDFAENMIQIDFNLFLHNAIRNEFSSTVPFEWSANEFLLSSEWIFRVDFTV